MNTRIDELLANLDIAGMGNNAHILVDCVKELDRRLEALEAPPAAPVAQRRKQELRRW
jgi:hypothetical protein